MKSKTVDLYYFSGTGNTYIVTKHIASLLEKNSYKVNLYCLEKANPASVNLNHSIGLAMPTAYFSTYPFVWDFINQLPRTNGTDLFMITTMAGMVGALTMQVKKIIQKKGYYPLGAEAFIMPSNLSKNANESAKLENLKQKAEIRAVHFVEGLINRNAKWSYNIFSAVPFDLVYKLANPPKRFRKWYPVNVDTSRCIQCNICYQACPADNIRMYEFPRFEDNCQMCMRCFSFCPVQAIYFKNTSYLPYHSVEIDEIMQTGK
ncbi:MAG: EFR1 family ferrodoxin [Candidatus Cloacimonetes bacterium]|nr:EFR1 family ferrodoxin [Candidatus Cloacimonadota bacterium]